MVIYNLANILIYTLVLGTPALSSVLVRPLVFLPTEYPLCVLFLVCLPNPRPDPNQARHLNEALYIGRPLKDVMSTARLRSFLFQFMIFSVIVFFRICLLSISS